MSSLYCSTNSSQSSDRGPLPKCRIQCLNGQIKVGSKQFQSATDALSAYIQQFEHLPRNENVKKSVNFLPGTLLEAYLSKKFNAKNADITRRTGYLFTKEDVETLFTSKPSNVTQEDLPETVELRSTMMQHQKQQKTGLQEEVEAALLRSARLLEKVSKENVQSSQSLASDLSDVPTDILLLDSLLPQSNTSSITEGKTKHVYSYHLNRPQTTKTSAHSHAPVTYTNFHQSRDRNKRASNGILLQNFYHLQRANSLSSAHCKQHTASNLRSQSASPAFRHGTLPFFMKDERDRKSNPVPSWIKDENVSEISDSIWQPRSKVNIPSINLGVDTQINGDSELLVLGTSTMYTPSLDGEHFDCYKQKALIKEPVQHSTPIDTKGSNFKRTFQLSSTETFLNSITLPQVSGLQKSLEDLTFSSENIVRRRSLSSSSSSSSSSLDTLALLAGRTEPFNSATSNLVSKDKLNRNHGSDSESEGLDGDRTWEKFNNYKPLVHVENIETSGNQLFLNGLKQNSDGNFSGPKQPGSMEALKNMLFKLQAEENATENENRMTAIESGHDEQLSGQATISLPALQDYNFSQEPGGHSLEQALIHLNRLKELVQNTQVATGSALKT